MNRNTTPLPIRSLATAIPLALLFAMPAPLQAAVPKAAVPDLTVPDAAATIDKESRKWTYNLGPTGMRGWIYHAWSVTAEQDATTGFAPYQILVTTVADKTPAAG
ncbi:MAG: hypothetical protein K9M97_10520, partial [Akkermansiaceae bacterium]|nr:hypothetical protein [Akkermansiaceae bacterium]